MCVNTHCNDKNVSEQVVLFVQVKNYAAIDKSPVHGDDFTFVPEPCMLINICSKDTMNITISKSSISVFQKLAKVSSSPSCPFAD